MSEKLLPSPTASEVLAQAKALSEAHQSTMEEAFRAIEIASQQKIEHEVQMTVISARELITAMAREIKKSKRF